MYYARSGACSTWDVKENLGNATLWVVHVCMFGGSVRAEEKTLNTSMYETTSLSLIHI